jgi:DNA-binding transcriptional LysR family regulator
MDLAIGVFSEPPANTVTQPYVFETFGVALRPGHPRGPSPLDLDRYCSLDHLLVSHDNEPRGTVDRVLASLGRRRRIAATLPNMMLAFAAVSQSDMVLTAPRGACLYAQSHFGIAIQNPPIDLCGFEASIMRHQNGLSDPAINWLVGLIGSSVTLVLTSGNSL